MSSSRFVKYNEDLFKIPSGTKKRKTGGDKRPIKIKPQTNKTIKRKILDELRKNQQQQLNTLSETSPPPPSPPPESKFETDFKNSVDYMQSFVDNHKKETISSHKLNSTIKEKKTYPVPTYGCLKNGSLPTYRNIHGVTLKHNNPSSSQFANIGPSVDIGPYVTTNFAEVTSPSTDVISPSTDVISPSTDFISPSTDVISPSTDFISPSTNFISPSTNFISPPITSNSITERIKSPHEILLTEKTKQKSKVKPPMDKHKRRFLRRTYHVGKDKYKPKVGVLLPNKTIRKRVTTSSYLLKQTPIEEIRKFLLKKGFIKVGSSAPNDVLRKMYESIQMIDGEINNHNSENLLHNFFNHK